MKRVKQSLILTCLSLSITACGLCIEDDFTYGSTQEISHKLERLEIYFEAEMYQEASELLDTLIFEFPNEPRFGYLRAIVDYQQGDYSRAQRSFIEFISAYPQVPEPYYLLGEINLRQGKPDLARLYWTKYCQLVPGDMDAQRKLAALSADNATFTKGPVSNKKKQTRGVYQEVKVEFKPAPEVTRRIYGTSIIKDGREDSGLVEKIGYYGGCVHSREPESIKLINGSFCTWSSMGIDFTRPMDLRGKVVALELKGKQGGEKLELTFRDKFAKSHTPQLVLMPEEQVFPDWRKLKVSMVEDASKIDLSSVVHMGLEFGFSTVQNPANSTLFLKDIIIEDASN